MHIRRWQIGDAVHQKWRKMEIFFTWWLTGEEVLLRRFVVLARSRFGAFGWSERGERWMSKLGAGRQWRKEN
jgi:hypothetical protein